MEKILKKILIPFLFVILTIKSAYAETINVYGIALNQNNSFSPNDTSIFSYKYSFDIFDNTFNYYLRNVDNSNNNINFINAVIYYQEESNQYLIINFYTTQNISSTNHSIDIVNQDNSTNLCYSYYNQNEELTKNCNFWGSLGFYTKTYSRYWYVNNFGWDYSFVSETTSSPYTWVYNNVNNTSPNYALTKFTENIDKFQFVKVIYDNFYIQGQLIGSASGESPEEPEEPEIPIFNENLNKFYVPNYEKGQCVEVLDKDTLRVFDDENTDFYTDYYINSNYISKTGQVGLDYEKNCSQLEFTNIRYYGNDLPQILFILFCLTIFTISIPYILYKRFRKR